MTMGAFPGVEARGAVIRITFSYRGERCRETLALLPTSANLKQAARLRAEILRKIAMDDFNYAEYFPKSRRLAKLGLAPLKTAPTFGALSEMWLRFKRAECQLSTTQSYAEALHKHLLPVLGERTIDSIRYSELAQLVATFSCGHPKTCNNVLTPLRGVFELAVRDGLLQDNPARHIRNRRLQKALPCPFTRAEMESIIRGFARQGLEAARNYFEFAFVTGLRTSELIALRWSDVDFIGRGVQIHRARVRNHIKSTKTYRAREIELTERAAQVLSRQLALSFSDESEALVFLEERTGQGYQDDRLLRERYWYPLLDDLNIPRRPAYNTRHTYATLALLAGAAPMWVARQLGHANMRLLLETYSRWIAHSDTGQNRDKLNVLFGPAPVLPQQPQPFDTIRNKINALN